MNIRPFRISVGQEALDDLQARIAKTRWPDVVANAGWELGASIDYMRELIEYWLNRYDWRVQEAELNAYPHYLAEVEGMTVHFVHARGKGPHPTPIVITHGWPGSFFELLKLVPLLTDPARFGGDPADAFDVVIPSLPGYAFSDRPAERGGMSMRRAARLWARLMTEGLGYPRFGAAGGDFGAIVTQQLAAEFPHLLLGIHLTYIGFYISTPDSAELSEHERAYLGAMQSWIQREGAYFMIQSTKPASLAFGLNDSPIGLAAWITEKFRSWMDCDGIIENRISKDELLTNIMIYWLTQTIGSSIRSYSDQTLERLTPLPASVPAAVTSQRCKSPISSPRIYDSSSGICGQVALRARRETPLRNGGRGGEDQDAPSTRYRHPIAAPAEVVACLGGIQV